MAVADQPGGDRRVRAREHGADRAGIAVVERAHRVEQVRAHRGAGVEAREELAGRRRRVSERHHHAGAGELRDQLERTGELGRHGDHPHPVRGAPAAGVAGGGFAEVRRRVGAARTGGEHRPFEVQAEHGCRTRAVAVRSDGVERRVAHGRRPGDDGGQERRGALDGQPRRELCHAVRFGAEVDAVAAVDLQVDESRAHPPVGSGGVGHDAGDHAAVEHHPAPHHTLGCDHAAGDGVHRVSRQLLAA